MFCEIAVSYNKAGLSQPHQPLEGICRVLCTIQGVISFMKQSLLMTAIPGEKPDKKSTWEGIFNSPTLTANISQTEPCSKEVW